MYCIKCGVELADTEATCPLCGTRVFHPDLVRPKAQPLYPPNQLPQPAAFSRGGVIIATVLFLLPSLITLQCDLQITGRFSWSGYVIGALLLLYVSLILPGWFQKPNPVIFVPCSFAALLVYLLYIDYATGGKPWFLSFAFPVTGFLCLVVTAVVALCRYVKKGYLDIFGGALAALGAFFPLIGFLVNITFRNLPGFALWTLYPATALLLLGCTLIFLAICRPAREIMQRKLFF
jgi:hypothetical protein